MRKNLLIALATIALTLAGAGCATKWADRPDAQKVAIVQGALEVVVAPECLRVKEGPYRALCQEVVADAIVSAEAIILKDASLLCPSISSKADQCSRITDESPEQDLNVATCKRVIRAAGLACELFVPRPDAEPAPE